MQLNQFTDYGLRVLMCLLSCREQDRLTTVTELARLLDVSSNHLVKIVHFMSQQSWIKTTRGRGGGIRLADHAELLSLGGIVRSLERTTQVVDCNKPLCVFSGKCGLKRLLDQALEQFYLFLDKYQLKDLQASKHNDASEVIKILFSKAV
jgi:Rrf2 family nitric oxide-sensitive transcriptional repressor